MELIQLLVKQLGISDQQAQGGLGLILNQVKDKVGTGELDKIKNLIPGADELMKSAPSAGGGLGGMLGGIAGALGGDKLKALGDLGGVLDGFKKLGIDGDKIGQFASVLTKFLGDKGGADVAAILGKLLGGK